jgi:hypothetical protein
MGLGKRRNSATNGNSKPATRPFVEQGSTRRKSSSRTLDPRARKHAVILPPFLRDPAEP